MLGMTLELPLLLAAVAARVPPAIEQVPVVGQAAGLLRDTLLDRIFGPYEDFEYPPTAALSDLPPTP